MRCAAALMLVTGLVPSGCTSSSPEVSPVGVTAGAPSPAAQEQTSPYVIVSPDPAVCPVSDVNESGYSEFATHQWQDPKDVRAAFLCRTSMRRVAGDGTWRYVVVDRVTSGLEDLLRVYAEPDGSPTRTSGTTACTTEGQPPLVVWLQTEDGAAAVRAPVGLCSKPIHQAEHYFRLLTTVPVRATKVEQVRTQLSLDTGCDDLVDAREIGRLDHLPRKLASHPLRAGTGTRVCEFAIPKNRPWKKGDLRAGHRLTAKEAADIRATLRRAPADPTCAAGTPRHFVVMFGWDSWLAVSPDGCVWQDDGVWRAGPGLFKRLAS